MKIIFLDVDGVLNSFRNIAAFGRFPFPNNEESEPELDQIALGMVRNLTKLTGANVVLHSMWRRHVDPVEFGNRPHINLPIIDRTDQSDKVISIIGWLKKHPEVTDFVVLEDNDICSGFGSLAGDWPEWIAKVKENQVQTNMIEGLTFVDFANAFMVLQNIDIADIEKKRDRMRDLQSGNASLLLGTDERTPEQREKDAEEWKEIQATIGIGEWAVLQLLSQKTQ